MKIAIIGAGFTGLAAAHALVKEGHTVTILEKEENPGGLALGYKKPKWNWTLEHHYHHWFSNDTFALDLAQEINHEVIIKKPHTNIYVKNAIYELDSISAFLKFPLLNIFQRLRHLLVLGILFKLNPFWKPFEKIKATFLPKLIGTKAYKIIWEPQLHNKLGKYMHDVSLVWFWARIKKRTPYLAYPKGGFLEFANHITNHLEEKKVNIHFQTEIEEISQKDNTCYVKINGRQTTFDRILVTLPSFLFLKITPQLPDHYRQRLLPLKGIGAINVVLRLKNQFFSNNTYWLSVCDTTSPLMAIIEHTNFMDKQNYNNEHIVYLGNYLEKAHSYFKLSKEEILKEYDPFLKKINPHYQDTIIDFDVFKAPFAQPIIPTNYSQLIPPMKTPLSHIYLANIEQVYPWDRGTNYAIELGIKAASLIHEESI